MTGSFRQIASPRPETVYLFSLLQSLERQGPAARSLGIPHSASRAVKGWVMLLSPTHLTLAPTPGCVNDLVYVPVRQILTSATTL